MSELATYTLAPIFRNLRQAVEGFRDHVLLDAGTIMRREEETSIRLRWFKTGATVQSLQEVIVINGNKKTFRLFPTTFYAKFGEYGTGQRGAATGQPAPAGYRYGSVLGITARRYSRIAVTVAETPIDAHADQRARTVSRNMTVN